VTRLFLTSALAIWVFQGAHAQSSEQLPLVQTCTVVAPAEKGQPRLVLVESRNGEKVTTYIQINGPTKLAGRLDAVTISVAPFDAGITVKGVAPAKDATYVRAIVTEGWKPLLDRIRKGEKLTLSAGNETITIPLAGSGLAIAAFQRCTQ